MSERKIVRVRDVMRKSIEMIDGLETIRDALKKMRQANTKCLIVNKRHEDDEYGILLNSDIAFQVLAKDRAPERVNVYEIMTKPIIPVDPAMDIRYCARLFNKFDISRAPVLHNDQIIGIVSITDMVMYGLYEA